MTEELEPEPAFSASIAPSGENPALVIGIGGHAGGLDAIREFFTALDEGAGMTFLVHEPVATPRGELFDVIRPLTQLPVRALDDGARLVPDHVFIVPAASILSFEGGLVRLHPASDGASAAPLDTFFKNLADAFGARTVGVILSGAGTDGVVGIQRVSNAGGMTLAQEPAHATYDHLPRSAIATGVIDHVLTAAEMAQVLLAYVGQVAVQGDASTAPDSEAIVLALNEVCDLLERATDHNFKHYKTSTLVRRIRRRMHVLHVATTEAYVDRLRRDADELTRLFRELLIGVTAFFRDPEAFEALARDVLRPMIQSRSNAQLRFWVPGCATGEEAYSLAIAAREIMAEMSEPPELAIFATDIDERALSIARRAVYPAGISEQLSPERRERYFVKRGKSFQVAREIREMVLFSPHNLINDPPFSRLDLISCRNLLIYFGPHLQQKLFPLFHYALRQDGVLFLGTSESVSAHKELFTPIDAKNRISRRKPTAIRNSSIFPPNPARGSARTVDASSDAEPDLHQVMQRMLLDEFAPKSVVVSEDGKILSASGDMQRYLTVAAGTFQNNVVRLARPGLRVALRAALTEAVRLRRKVVHDKVSVPSDGVLQRVRLTVQPMPRFGEEDDLFMVVFEDLGSVGREDSSGPSTIETNMLLEQLERELTSTRSDLEKTIRDFETANEELKSSNEELLSMNEELQSANEELETSKDEVQQTNQALARAHAKLSNLLTSAEIATIFLDDAQCVQSFTPAVTGIYNLKPADIGRPLSDITHTARAMPAVPDASALRDTIGAKTDEVMLEDGRQFLRRVLPYRTHEGRHEGVVVTFADVTALKRAEDIARRHQNQLQMITDALPVLIGYVDSDFRYRFNNQAYERWFGLSPSELYGKHMRDVLGEEAFAQAEVWLKRVLAGELVSQEATLSYALGGTRTVLAQYTPDRAPDGTVRGFFAVVHDTSEHEKAALALAEAKLAAEQANRAKSEFLANMSHEIRTPISAILGYAELLTSHVRDPDNLASVEAIRRNGQYLVEIINDILDLSKIEARMLRAERIRVSPHALLREAVDASAGRASERGLTLRLTFDGPLPQSIESDPTRVRQILLNLLGNALKFTNRGGVEVRAKLLAGELLEVAVTDTGIGMSVEQQQGLFEPFTQGDSSVTRQYGGTGLGLAISKRLSELLGGTISAESQLGSGSTFRFTIATGPLEGIPMTEAATVQTDPPPRAALRLTGHRVLVVDDRPDMRYLVQTFLEEAEAEVLAVGDGSSALRRVQLAAAAGEPFRAIVLDMQMPGMDGYAVARRLRESGYTGRIVAVTANAMKGDREQCIAAGCDDYVAKPVDRIALLTAVAQAQPSAASERAADAPQPTSKPERGAAPARRRKKVLLVDDSEDATFVMGQLLHMRGFEIVSANSGLEAIEAAERDRPDAVVLDLGLPDMDGFEVLARLKQIESLAETRFIALTGRNLADGRPKAGEVGFHDQFVKPADIDRLVASLEEP